MFDWLEISLALAAVALLICASTPRLRLYRSVLLGGSALMVITALIPRRGNSLGQYLFAETNGSMHLPLELFGIAWWILGAWLVRSILAMVLRRTLFPSDYQPHARRLFADLASGLVYVVAFVGIMDTVLKQPVSALLATSGVLAIVLGLALQNTLADVFSGLAINIEHPFAAGDWITMNDDVEGQVIEINWRATLIRTSSNDMIVIPNSVIAKAIVTNHRKLNEPYVHSLSLAVDQMVPPALVIKTLQSAASTSSSIAPGSMPTAYACGLSDTVVDYELCFAVNDFARTADVKSEVIRRVIDALQIEGIQIGTQPADLRIIGNAAEAARKPAINHSRTR
jgi:small-conductance mechanosensitive channel